MNVKIELRGVKSFYYIQSNLSEGDVIDLIDNGYTITCAKTGKIVSRANIGNVIYLNRVE